MIPSYFVDLHTVDPSLIINLRYFSDENFVGRRLDGYQANRVFLTHKAAKALANVQNHVLSQGYALVVYDAYRPQQTVEHFIRWAADVSDQIRKDDYYPHIDKRDVFKLGYIAKHSSHSRGSTVDLTLIQAQNILQDVRKTIRTLEDGMQIAFFDDGTEDMGTSFDFLGDASHHDSPLVSLEQTQKREILRDVMKKNGFQDYEKEWWHYTLMNEPFPDTYFDFPIA